MCAYIYIYVCLLHSHTSAYSWTVCIYIYIPTYTHKQHECIYFHTYKNKYIYIYIYIYSVIQTSFRGQAFMSTPKHALEETKMSRWCHFQSFSLKLKSNNHWAHLLAVVRRNPAQNLVCVGCIQMCRCKAAIACIQVWLCSSPVFSYVYIENFTNVLVGTN